MRGYFYPMIFAIAFLVGSVAIGKAQAMVHKVEFVGSVYWDTHDCLARGHGRRIIFNRAWVPCIRKCAFVKFKVGERHAIVAPGSVIYIDGDYYRVLKVVLRNDDKGERGYLTCYELWEKPKLAHIVNRPHKNDGSRSQR